MQLKQDILLITQRHYIGMHIDFVLLMLGEQNTARRITVLGPSNCQAVRSDVPQWATLGPAVETDYRNRQNTNNEAHSFFLLDSYQMFHLPFQ